MQRVHTPHRLELMPPITDTHASSTPTTHNLHPPTPLPTCLRVIHVGPLHGRRFRMHDHAVVLPRVQAAVVGHDGHVGVPMAIVALHDPRAPGRRVGAPVQRPVGCAGGLQVQLPTIVAPPSGHAGARAAGARSVQIAVLIRLAREGRGSGDRPHGQHRGNGPAGRHLVNRGSNARIRGVSGAVAPQLVQQACGPAPATLNEGVVGRETQTPRGTRHACCGVVRRRWCSVSAAHRSRCVSVRQHRPAARDLAHAQ
jgi:hypothetical protein